MLNSHLEDKFIKQKNVHFDSSLLIKSFMFVKHDFTGHDLSKSDLGNFQFLMK